MFVWSKEQQRVRRFNDQTKTVQKYFLIEIIPHRFWLSQIVPMHLSIAVPRLPSTADMFPVVLENILPHKHNSSWKQFCII
jgi:hypothetical protein